MLSGGRSRAWDWVKTRSQWLGHPAFAVAVVLLALNDHVLKGRYSSWWTGKLSDIAGVAVLGTLAVALLGRRRGLAATAAAFGLLKTIPGLAELSSPMLGGVTRRDHSDLLALLVLLPLDWMFRHGETVNRSDRGKNHQIVVWPVARTANWWRRGVATVARVAPAFWVVAAVVTTSATSCGPKPAVTEVAAHGADLFALLDRGFGEGRWAKSNDGGRTWMRGGPPPEHPASPPSNDTYVDAPTGPIEVCASDVCYRIVNRRVIQRQLPDGTWRDEARLSDEEFRGISTGCAGAQRGVLRSIAAAGSPPGSAAVASLGADGVLVRSEDGHWSPRRVLNVPPPGRTALDRAVAVGVVLAGPILPLSFWLAGRRRRPWRGPAIVVSIVGWIATVGAVGIAAMGNSNGSIPPAATTVIALVGLGLTMLAAIWTARRQRPAVPLERSP